MAKKKPALTYKKLNTRVKKEMKMKRGPKTQAKNAAWLRKFK